ncbi:MAG: 1-deoxy-D-xylulose-5-phosphate synthase [Bacteroidetes bacterium]|nr:1-deoxy-D-xylulose-5-phosphate synthase [Bacteroidota bacterium]
MEKIAMRDAFGRALIELGTEDQRLVVLDADVSSSTKTALFGAEFPDRFFNVGVAESNLADVAAGLATAGYRPVISTFSIFLALKSTDQIRNVICYNNLPVIIAGGYGGLSDSFDGASHQSITDLAIMRAFPNMTVIVPGDGGEVRDALQQALELDGPVFLRLSRNPTPQLFKDAPKLQIGKIRKITSGNDLTIAVTGIPTYMAVEAEKLLRNDGIEVDLLEISTIKPLDKDMLVASVKKTGRLLTVEEHSVIGGLGSACAETLSRYNPCLIDMIGIEDTFTESGPYDALMRKYGLSVENIVMRAKALKKVVYQNTLIIEAISKIKDF